MNWCYLKGKSMKETMGQGTSQGDPESGLRVAPEGWLQGAPPENQSNTAL